MNTMMRPWHRWMIYWDVFLAILAGIVVFVLLDLVSGGLLISVLTAGAVLAVVALFHYFVWGRVLARQIEAATPQTDTVARSPQSSMPVDEIVVGLDEQERRELLRLLDQSLSTVPGEQRTTALDRQLADKLRMFGA